MTESSCEVCRMGLTHNHVDTFMKGDGVYCVISKKLLPNTTAISSDSKLRKIVYAYTFTIFSIGAIMLWMLSYQFEPIGVVVQCSIFFGGGTALIYFAHKAINTNENAVRTVIYLVLMSPSILAEYMVLSLPEVNKYGLAPFGWSYIWLGELVVAPIYAVGMVKLLQWFENEQKLTGNLNT